MENYQLISTLPQRASQNNTQNRPKIWLKIDKKLQLEVSENILKIQPQNKNFYLKWHA